MGGGPAETKGRKSTNGVYGQHFGFCGGRQGIGAIDRGGCGVKKKI